MLHFFLDLLFPPMSLNGDDGGWITSTEKKQWGTSPLRFDEAVLQARGMPSLHRLVGSGMYVSSPSLRQAVHRFKYRRMRVYGQALGLLMADCAGMLSAPDDAVLCPVPLHWTRRFWRGFNQSDLLASVVTQRRAWHVRQLLRRIRPTGSQARRTRDQRRSALHAAFRWQGDHNVPRHVILLDDVCTSGATLEECARTLREAGVERVDALVLAVG